METIATLASALDVTTDDVQAYVQQLVGQQGEAAVVAQRGTGATETVLTDEAARRVRVQLTH